MQMAWVAEDAWGNERRWLCEEGGGRWMNGWRGGGMGVLLCPRSGLRHLGRPQCILLSCH